MDDAASAEANQNAVREERKPEGESVSASTETESTESKSPVSSVVSQNDDFPGDKPAPVIAPAGDNPILKTGAYEMLTKARVPGASWLNYKAKLATVMSTDAFKGASHDHQDEVLKQVYAEITAINDPVTPAMDPIWFRVWLRGAQPDADSIRGTFSTLCRQSSYTKMDDASKDAIGDDVERFAPE